MINTALSPGLTTFFYHLQCAKMVGDLVPFIMLVKSMSARGEVPD